MNPLVRTKKETQLFEGRRGSDAAATAGTLSNTVFARPVMCEAGPEEPFDEHTAWIFCPTLTRHRPAG